MKLNKRVALATVLTAALLLLSACSGSGSSTTTSSSGNEKSGDVETTPAKTDTETAGTDKAAPVDCTLKVWGSTGGITGSISSPGVQTDPVAKELERVSGCKIELYPQESDDILSTKLASGDIPDLIMVQKRFAKRLIDSKAIMPLDDLVAKNAPHLSKLDKMLDYDKQFMSDDSHQLYFLTRVPESYTMGLSSGYFIQWNYYKELGMPAINSVDDYLHVLSDIVKKHPKTADGKKVYGLSPWFDWGFWSWTQPGGIFGLWNRDMNDYDLANNMKASNVVLNENSSYWRTAEIYYKAKQKGLLDPDSFTQKFDNVAQKVKNKQIMGAFDGSGFSQLGQDNNYFIVPPQEGTKGFFTGYYEPLGADSHYAISAKTKYPDRVMKLLDYLYSIDGVRTIFNGVKGKDWDDKDGTITVDPTLKDKQAADKDFAIHTGIMRYGNPLGALPLGQFRGQVTFFAMLPQFQNPSEAKKEYWKTYGVTSDTELIKQRVQYPSLNSAAVVTQPLTPDDIKRIDDKIINYLLNAGPKLVLAKNDEDYKKIKQQIIDDVKKMDLDKSMTYWDKVNNNVQKYMQDNNLNEIPAYQEIK